ncbi:hypothetical protein AQUCO_05700059v1 [Aquilegia coerulea]|uniref:Uncharacterized protein n=1 Tax=Aquilegia coerulea TaxID=218851 RepID=A0A2G5CFM7_AQUCA|nr:hypothetical protein AQUCO_05700059v1 [Aquilegia coerulea]
MSSLTLVSSNSLLSSFNINKNNNPINLLSLKNSNFISFNNTCHHLQTDTRKSRTSYQIMKNRERKGSLGVVCYSSPLSPHTLQWVSTISSAVLVLAKGTAIPKSFLVPLFALQAPKSIVSWIKGEYGLWTAFLALLVRLFLSVPGELELPFMAMLLVIVSPYQVVDLRGTQAGAIISLIVAGYLAFQHFSRLGSLRKAFDQGSSIATLALIAITAASCLLLI